MKKIWTKALANFEEPRAALYGMSRDLIKHGEANGADLSEVASRLADLVDELGKIEADYDKISKKHNRECAKELVG